MRQIILNNLSDEELEELINGAVNNLRGNTFEGKAAPIYLAEKSRRAISDTSNITLKISKRTFWTALLALTVAGVAMSFSIVDYFGDQSWREGQLSILTEIRDNTKFTIE